MIVTLTGKLVDARPLSAIIEANGIGYEVNIPVSTTEKLPSIGQNVKLYTLSIYREDSQTLYGFHITDDRDFFRLLVEKVSGIGPKIALRIMSKLSVELLKNAIAQEDVSLLSKCPGIGKKTAERLIIELKDKVVPSGLIATSSKDKMAGSVITQSQLEPSKYQDAVSALLALGYKAVDADKTVRNTVAKLGSDASVEEIIKSSLG